MLPHINGQNRSFTAQKYFYEKRFTFYPNNSELLQTVGQRIVVLQGKLLPLQRHQEAEIALLILAFRLQQATALNSIQHGQKTSINQLPFLVPLGIFRFCSMCSTPQD